MAKKAKKESSVKLSRTPVVAVMGHVDHGKTSILDAIRSTSVQAGEAGGITQNTRVHQIEYKDQKISFIDTPGHEAFSNMRERGANVTDIVMLVVAADDGVKPQTKESIDFALKAKVPVLVAINKIDLPNKNVQKVKRELTSAGLNLDEYGGDVVVAEVSAVKKKGLENLLESLLIVAEMAELKKKKVKDVLGTGYVLESRLDKHLGAVSLVLMMSGEVKRGNFVAYEGGHAKVRELLDENQQKLEGAKQGDPVWMLGIKEVLEMGESLRFVEEEKKAKGIVSKLEKKEIAVNIEEEPETEEEPDEDADLDILADLLESSQQEEDINYLNVIIKTDTQGTLEVVMKELEKIQDDQSKVKIISSGTGDITEQDIKSADTSHGLVIGFQVDVPKKVQELAVKERVLVRNYKVIYELLEEVEDVVASLGEPATEEVEIARAKVKKIFKLTNGQIVAGCKVISGTVLKGYKVYIEREKERLHNAKITAIKSNKDEVREVSKGKECGILLEPNEELEEKDEIVCYKIEKV